ncbi:YidC/Oxa1 family membrane protein insertase [Candidatus Saccharibacteria bacterium]|nr:YidC/Oxa1 family membrane protein insertase [Candidatus Saccharibacteria bacterium]
MNIFELLIVQPVFNLLLGLYGIFGDFGVAVILFTIIIRFAMWPLVVKQLHQVKAMRKLQPELVKIKKAAKGNRQVEGMKMLELYKKHGVKPFRSILMLLIQLPIFIALFQVIQVFTSHREQIEEFTYGFMQQFGPIRDLVANPDSFHTHFLGLVDLTGRAITAEGVSIFLLLLAVLAAVTQYIISKQTNPQTSSKRLRDVLAEAGDGKQPDQAELNAVMMSKMIKILPVFMFFVMLSLPGGVGLYYVTSNAFAAIQQHFLLKKDTEELEDIAESAIKKEQGKKATAKARAKQAQEAKTVSTERITRISAKDTRRK